MKTRYSYEEHVEEQEQELAIYLGVNDDRWPWTNARDLIESGWRKQ